MNNVSVINICPFIFYFIFIQFAFEFERAQKSLSFFKKFHGFTAPFNILCDESFVHKINSEGFEPLSKVAKLLLEGAVKFHTTK